MAREAIAPHQITSARFAAGGGITLASGALLTLFGTNTYTGATTIGGTRAIFKSFMMKLLIQFDMRFFSLLAN